MKLPMLQLIKSPSKHRNSRSVDKKPPTKLSLKVQLKRSGQNYANNIYRIS